MTKKQFLHSLANGREDVVQRVLDVLSMERIRYCVIGGLAVNAYADPVVSLDIDLVIAATETDRLLDRLRDRFDVKPFPHSVNLESADSDLRIQIQTDVRYEEFILRAEIRDVLGYKMFVASMVDVLQGKVWAYLDSTRRASKRQKDLADILRLVEKAPELFEKLPEEIRRSMP